MIRFFDRMVAYSIGLVFLALGLVMVASVVLIPVLLENGELQSQRDLLRLQADRMAEQEESYRRTLSALEAEDPLLLERVAYSYLRLKPTGAEVVQTTDSGPTPLSTIESWLHKPMPTAPEAGNHIIPPHLIRLVIGETRYMVLALGVVLLMLGLMLPGASKAADMQVDEED